MHIFSYNLFLVKGGSYVDRMLSIYTSAVQDFVLMGLVIATAFFEWMWKFYLDLDNQWNKRHYSPLSSERLLFSIFKKKTFFQFSRFSRIGFYNDLAILVLDRPVRKSKYVIPVCLPKAGFIPPKERLAGRRATVVGWGTTYYGGKESTVQRQADLPLWRNEDCDRAYFQPITENFLCAGFSEGGVDACQVKKLILM